MDEAKRNKIRHIMKRLADITRVFNGEVDALNVEVNELMKEEDHDTSSNHSASG